MAEREKALWLVLDSENNWLHTSLDPETLKDAVEGAAESYLYDSRAELRAYKFSSPGVDIDCAPCFIGKCCKGKNCDPDCCNANTCNCNP